MAEKPEKDLFGSEEDIFKLLEQVQEQQNRQDSLRPEERSSGKTVPEAVPKKKESASVTVLENILKGMSDDDKKLIKESGKAAKTEAVKAVPKKTMDDYDRSVYGFSQLDEIKTGLDHGLDVSFYDSAELSFRQMREIRLGLEMGLDVSYYANKFYKDKQMREIRLGLMDGLDVSGYARLIYSCPDMQERRMKLLKEIYGSRAASLDRERFDTESGIRIILRDKQMKAYIKLTSPLSPDFNKTKLSTILALYNVVEGVEFGPEFDKPEELKLGHEYKVAEGYEGKPGVDGYYEYKVEGLGENGPKIKEDGSIDYRATRHYAAVRAGDTVAVYHPASSGEPGSTVTGIPLESSDGTNLARYKLEGIRLLEDNQTYIAQRDGVVTVKGENMSVQKLLEMQGDVAYGSGNISYDGTISINGNIRDNVVIEVGGDILVNGFVEGAQIKAGGNVVVNKGVNGNDKGVIQAGGNVTSSFFENVTVLSAGNIECGYILNSNVSCKGDIKTEGRRSSICGGTAVAMGGIETDVLGSVAGIKTSVRLGEKINSSSRLNAIVVRQKEMETAILKAKTAMAEVLKKLGPMNGRQHPMFIKLQDLLGEQLKEMDGIKEERAALEKEMSNESRKFIKVNKKIYANTYMTISGANMIFDHEEPGGKFFEDDGRVCI